MWVRGHENVHKRVLNQTAGCNPGLPLRGLTGVGTLRSLQRRAFLAICGLTGRLLDRPERLTGAWGPTDTGVVRRGLIAHRQAA